MKSLFYQGFVNKGYRYLRTRYEKGETIFELEPEKEPEVPAGQKLRRRGYRWRTVRSVSSGLKPVVLKVKVPRGHFWRMIRTLESSHRGPPLIARLGEKDFFYFPAEDGVAVYRIDPPEDESRGPTFKLVAALAKSEPLPDGTSPKEAWKRVPMVLA